MDPLSQPVGFEVLLVMMLPPRYHWLHMVFREAADQVWSWLPIIILLYLFYRFMAYQKSCDAALPSTKNILAQLLQGPTDQIEGLITARVYEIVQEHASAATAGVEKLARAALAPVNTRLTNMDDALSKVAEKHAANEDSTAQLQEDIRVLNSSFSGELPTRLRRAITGHVDARVERMTQRASDAIMNRFMCLASGDVKQKLLNSGDNSQDADLSVLNVSRLWAGLQNVRQESGQQIDLLQYKASRQQEIIDAQRERLSQQDQTVATLVSKIDTLTTINATTQAQLSEILCTIDAQATQLQELTKISANGSRLESKQKTFTDPHGQLKTDANVLSDLEGKLQGFEAKLEELIVVEEVTTLAGRVQDLEAKFQQSEFNTSNASKLEGRLESLGSEVQQAKISTRIASKLEGKINDLGTKLDRMQTSIDTIYETNSEVDNRIESLEADRNKIEGKQDTDPSADGKTDVVQAALSELSNVQREVQSLDNRTETLEGSTKKYKTTFGQLKSLPDTIVTLTNRLETCEGVVVNMRQNIGDMKDDMAHIRGDIGQHNGWFVEDKKSIEQLWESVYDCEAYIKELQSLDTEETDVAPSNTDANNAADAIMDVSAAGTEDCQSFVPPTPGPTNSNDGHFTLTTSSIQPAISTEGLQSDTSQTAQSALSTGVFSLPAPPTLLPPPSAVFSQDDAALAPPPGVLEGSGAPHYAPGFNPSHITDFNFDFATPAFDSALEAFDNSQSNATSYSLNPAASSFSFDSLLDPSPSAVAHPQNSVTNSAFLPGLSVAVAGAAGALHTTFISTAAAPPQDEEMADFILDPENPPQMSEDFNDDLFALAGGEEVGSETDAQGETDDEIDLIELHKEEAIAMLDGTRDW